MSKESDSILRVYMNEIAKTDLLTIGEELELAERIKDGDSEARDHMIRANLRLVVKIAKDYSNYGLPLADLISEGNMGLMKAVEKYDPEKGGKLSTYASWWIKQSIKRALSNQSKTVRLPVHMVDKIARLRKITVSLTEELGREPSNDELSEILGIPRKKLALLKQAAQRPTSLDAPVAEDGATTFSETISDSNAIDPSEALTAKEMHNELGPLLKILDQRETAIIGARYGLNGKKPSTLEEISRDFGVTRERIRQLQNIALEKMHRALGKKENPIPVLSSEA
ncbi:MAG: RNA polymerase primary sigma factor [Akkermansiaceae bacterium]|jgi:RNA polymerase primary sigma factor|tara:strand:+ start:6676 stop:7524 length:849 start_codon:yes stop_codon:yes gene_type:complete